MNSPKSNRGFTLVELMITLGVLAVLSAIAIPAYKGYITTTCENTVRQNIQTLKGFEENYRIETSTYLAGTFNAGDDPTTNALAAGLHWNPDDNKVYTYVVTAGSTGNLSSSFQVAVTGSPNKCSATSITYDSVNGKL